MKLLITGGAGFIGSNYIRYALKEHPEDRIVNLDLLTYAGSLENVCEAAQNPRYSFVQGDIADRAFVFGLFERERFDAVVNFAAETSPLRPSSPYSSSKASADLFVLAYQRTFGLPVTVSHCSNNYGPRQFPEKLIPLRWRQTRP